MIKAKKHAKAKPPSRKPATKPKAAPPPVGSPEPEAAEPVSQDLAGTPGPAEQPVEAVTPAHLPPGWILQTGDGPAARSEYYAVPPASGERYWLSTRNTARARGRAISEVMPLMNDDPELVAQAYGQLYRTWTQRRAIRAGWVLADNGPQFHIIDQ